MQITFTNDFANGPRMFTAQEIASFLQDEQTAKTMLESTFFNNISLTFNVGFGSYRGVTMANQGNAEAAPNTVRAVYRTYTELRTDLLTFGQPNFFTAANLPAGASINNFSLFYVTSSEAKALGLPVQAGVDGNIGIGANFGTGATRVAAFLHEITHAMGRYDPNVVGRVPAFDLMRFRSAGNRLFLDSVPSLAAYFSLDGGVTTLADWGRTSDPSDFLNPPLSTRTPNDPFNEIAGTSGQLTPVDIQAVDALGFSSPVINPPLQAGTSAVMVLFQTSAPPSTTNGTYLIYDLGNNATLAGYTLGRLGPDRQFVTLGRFNDGDTSDMLLRDR